MVIFHSYVSLPEGNHYFPHKDIVSWVIHKFKHHQNLFSTPPLRRASVSGVGPKVFSVFATGGWGCYCEVDVGLSEKWGYPIFSSSFNLKRDNNDKALGVGGSLFSEKTM